MGQEYSKLKRKQLTVTDGDLEQSSSTKSTDSKATGVCSSVMDSKQRQANYLALRDVNREADRLHQMNFVMKEVLGGNIMPSAESCINEDARILDVACGPGTWILDFATDHPEMEFYGIDFAGMFPADIKPGNVTFLQQDVLEGLPFESETFDLVQMRMMINSWTKEDWPFVIGEIFRVLKRGGYIQLVENGRLLVTATDSEGLKFKERIEQFLISRGQDPDSGDKLEGYQKQAGFKIIEHSIRSLPLGWGGPIGALILDDLRDSVLGVESVLSVAFGMEGGQFENYINGIMQRLKEFKSTVNCYVVIGQKPEDRE